MVQAPHHRFSFDDYVLLEEDAGGRHEFLDGQVWAMAGGTPEHARMAGNVLTLLNIQLARRRCTVYPSDLRIRVKATGLGTYPDVSVFCGHLEIDLEDRRRHTAVNPKVLVEVLSPSTETYDRGEKLAHYKQIESLDEIVLVAHDRPAIEVIRREADGTWSHHVSGEGETARLASIACDVPVAEVYRDPFAPA